MLRIILKAWMDKIRFCVLKKENRGMKHNMIRNRSWLLSFFLSASRLAVYQAPYNDGVDTRTCVCAFGDLTRIGHGEVARNTYNIRMSDTSNYDTHAITAAAHTASIDKRRQLQISIFNDAMFIHSTTVP